MITVVSHSLGVDNAEGERIMHRKTFKRYGLMCKLYILCQMIFEDYIEIYEDGRSIG